MALLEVDRLSVALPAGAERSHAVDGVSFDVAAGEIVCLVGESGSGKTVIAQSVMGLLPPELRPSGGSMLLDGENLLAAGETRLRGPSLSPQPGRSMDSVTNPCSAILMA